MALVPEEALETRGGVPVAPGPWGSQDISVDPAAARPKIENRDANTTLEPRRKRWVVSQFEFLHRVVSGPSPDTSRGKVAPLPDPSRGSNLLST